MYISKIEYDLRMKDIKRKNESIKRKMKLKEESNKYKRRMNVKTSTKVLCASVIAVILFTMASLFIQYTTGTEVNDTLTTLWFSFWTVEIVALAGIKVTKVIKNNSLNNIIDEFENEDDSNEG